MILIHPGVFLGLQDVSSYRESDSSLSDEPPTLPEAGEQCLMEEVTHIINYPTARTAWNPEERDSDTLSG